MVRKQLGMLGGLLTCLMGSGYANAQIMDIFEPVATDGSIGTNATVPTNWGGHQPRIVRHKDDSIRLVYLSTDTNGISHWNLMHRAPLGGWTLESSGTTFDDVTLMRNEKNDAAYVLSWPNSVPTIYASPNFLAVPLSSSGANTDAWPSNLAKNRQYMNTGISADGSTYCLKVEREENVNPPNSKSHVLYSCAEYNQYTSNYEWPATPLDKGIGPRYVYDYLHVNPAGMTGLIGVSKRDLYRSASNVPNATVDYVKNGLRMYKTGLTETEDWAQSDFIPEIYAPPGATRAPEAGNQDAFIDSKGRRFVAYTVTNPQDNATAGNFVYITDANGTVIYQGSWGSKMENYGNSRFYEDDKGRLWVLWSNRGTKRPEVKIYPIIESQNPQTFALGAAVDLSAKIGKLVPDGYAFYIAAPRGGNVRSKYIDAIFNACGSLQYDLVNAVSGSCYGADNSGRTQVYYARITLPN